MTAKQKAQSAKALCPSPLTIDSARGCVIGFVIRTFLVCDQFYDW